MNSTDLFLGIKSSLLLSPEEVLHFPPFLTHFLHSRLPSKLKIQWNS